MQILRLSHLRFLLLAASFYAASCATITVNVYFPAEEVREAYSSLEEEFLEQPSAQPTPPPAARPTPGPQSRGKYPDKPVLSERKVIVLKKEVSLDFGEYAWAQGNIAQQITEKIRSMPDVIDAYKRRSRRLATIKQMLSQGLVAEGSQGLLVQKGSLSPEQTQAFNAENSDRQIIIRGMAKAIVEINNIEPTPENIEKVLPEAARQFASVRRSER
ncbi:MAG TPA: DUF1318 domain-containing protein [Thermodesulfobacteriota bacterium]|nr:DUF1318 domain-containing protein [Thermodesulfobacteriota bacterium]